MEAELKENFPELDIELIEGADSIFDIKYNDKLIFSRHKIEGKRFPNEGEISKLIRQEMD